jgi:hypothetical protein
VDVGDSDKLAGSRVGALEGDAVGTFVNALWGLSGETHGLCFWFSELGSSMRELNSEVTISKGIDAASINAGSTRTETVTGWGNGENTVTDALDCAGTGKDARRSTHWLMVSVKFEVH